MYIYIYENFRLFNISGDSIWTWYLAAIGVDFCYYWVHRACHGEWINQLKNEFLKKAFTCKVHDQIPRGFNFTLQIIRYVILCISVDKFAQYKFYCPFCFGSWIMVILCKYITKVSFFIYSKNIRWKNLYS